MPPGIRGQFPQMELAQRHAVALARIMLSSLKLSQFRCFDSLRLDLNPGMTAFIGGNAQGKTSILEAVCVLLRLQSPRTQSLNDLIQFDQSGFGLSGSWAGQELQLVNEVRRRRKLYHRENEISRGRDYLEHSGLVVWMGNDDLALITGSGGRRRRYLDFQAAQLYPGYRSAVRSYERALRSRNELLKENHRPQWSHIDAYTAVLVEHGNEVMALRRQLVEALDVSVREAQRTIGGDAEDLSLTYAPGSADDFAQTLEESRERDLRRGTTTAGPHRDDVEVAINGRPANRFASEGQQRTIALALKLGQLELLRAQRACLPILLVDDIFGELDPRRRESLTRALPPESQILITTTSLQWLPQSSGLEFEVFNVAGGSVTAGSRVSGEGRH